MDPEVEELLDRLEAEKRGRRQRGKYVVWVEDWASLTPNEQRLVRKARYDWQRTHRYGGRKGSGTRADRQKRARDRARKVQENRKSRRLERKYGHHTRIRIPVDERWQKAAYWQSTRETKQPSYIWARLTGVVGWVVGVLVALDAGEIGRGVLFGLLAWGTGRLVVDLVVYWPYRSRVRRRARELLALFEEARARSRRISPSVRSQVMDRDGGKCRYCGATEDLHIDHVEPHSLGGLTVADNLQVLCGSCNIMKGVLSDEQARRLILGDDGR